jgi:uncharacterized protein YcnI
MKRSLTALPAVVAALVAAAPAAAHSHLSPPVILSGTEQVITLSVPTEEDANTTRVELTPPPGFRIGGFTPSPGWNRQVEQTGSGEDTLITKVTWDGGRVPPDESATFQFLGEADSAQTYTFSVRQTYSDGTVEDWSGPEDSDTPAPTIEVSDSLGGDGGSSTLAVIALVVGVLALAAAIAALVAGSGRRSLA